MKNLLGFLKLTAQGGLLVVLPILLLILLLKEMVELVVGLATPIANLFPSGTFDNLKHPEIWAVALIAGLSLLIGLIMKSTAAEKLGQQVWKKTVHKFPVYNFVKTLVKSLVIADENTNFKPALFDAGNGQRQIIYLVEDLGNNEFTVLFPTAPTGFSGPVGIIKSDRIIPIDASLGQVNLVMNHLGLGAGNLLKK